MCFVNNKIQHEPLTITVTLIFVSVRSVSNYPIRFKILDTNFEFGKIFSRLFDKKFENIFFRLRCEILEKISTKE